MEGVNVFANVYDENNTWERVREYWYLITDIVNFFLCIANVAANLFLMFVILRFKRLKTRTNFYILNVAFTNTIYHMFVPVVSIILEVSPIIDDPHEAFCFFYLLEENALFTMYFFGIMIAVDWYIVNYHETFIRLHRKLYKYAISLVYLVSIMRYVIITVTRCIKGKTEIVHYLNVTFLIVVLILAVVNILKFRQQREQSTPDSQKTRYAIIIANIIIVSWLPQFIYYTIIIFDSDSMIMRRIVNITIIIPEVIANSNSAVLLCVLGRLDKHFKMAYGMAFKRNLKNCELDRDSDDDTSDDEEHEVDFLPEPINNEATNMLIY